MREQRNEELVQQRAREARAKNIITHGFPESFGANEEKEADSNRIRQLTDILEVNVKPKLITRFGKRDENRSRPIKLRMYKIDHKDQILNSLSKLKQAPEGFKSISVTEDYSGLRPSKACMVPSQ